MPKPKDRTAIALTMIEAALRAAYIEKAHRNKTREEVLTFLEDELKNIRAAIVRSYVEPD